MTSSRARALGSRSSIAAALAVGALAWGAPAHAWWDWGDEGGVCHVDVHRNEDALAVTRWEHRWEEGRLREQRLRSPVAALDGLRVVWEHDLHGRPVRAVVFRPDGERGRTLSLLWPEAHDAPPLAGVWDVDGDGRVDVVERWRFDAERRPLDVQVFRVPDAAEARGADDATERVGRFRYLWSADGALVRESVEGPDGAAGEWSRVVDPAAPDVEIYALRTGPGRAEELVVQRVHDDVGGCVWRYWDVDADGRTDWVERVCREADGASERRTTWPAPDASVQSHARQRDDGAARSVLDGPWTGWSRIERASGLPRYDEHRIFDASGRLLGRTIDVDSDGQIDERRTIVRGCGAP